MVEKLYFIYLNKLINFHTKIINFYLFKLIIFDTINHFISKIPQRNITDAIILEEKTYK